MYDAHKRAGERFRELALYCSITYTISWLLWSPYYAAAWFPVTWHANPVFHFAGSIGPLLGAFITEYIVNDTIDAGKIFRRTTLMPLLTALLLPFLIMGLSVLINYLLTGKASVKGLGTSHELPDGSLITFILLNIVVIGLGEEAGWRGFALPRLQYRFNALTSSAMLSVAWAIWHWPLFFYTSSGFYTMTLPGIAGWFFSLVLGSVLLTWLFNWSGGSIMVCAVFHGVMDLVFTAPYSDESIITYNGLLITITGVMVILLFKPAHLSPVKRTTC